MRIAAVAVLLLVLSGCAPAIVGSVATTAVTNKSPLDWAASETTGMDCSSVNFSYRQPYCQEVKDQKLEALKEAEQAPYCYQTLGRVTCYDTPDPFNNNQLPVRTGVR